jgi:hypothetical protein
MTDLVVVEHPVLLEGFLLAAVDDHGMVHHLYPPSSGGETEIDSPGWPTREAAEEARAQVAGILSPRSPEPEPEPEAVAAGPEDDPDPAPENEDTEDTDDDEPDG